MRSKKLTGEAERQIEEIKQKKFDYVSVFSTLAGKRVLKDLKAVCFSNKTTYSPDKGRTEFNEGTRFVVDVHIKNIMDMDVKRLYELIKEGE